MFNIILFILIIVGFTLYEHHKKKESIPLPILNYQYFGETFLLPELQRVARRDISFLEYPTQIFDILCIERLNVKRNQLVYTVGIIPRNNIENESMSKIIKSALCESLSRKLQFDYKITRTNVRIQMHDVADSTLKHVWLEFSDEMVCRINSYQAISYCD